MDDFELFWKAWPKRVAKADARKAWEQTKNIRPPIEKIIDAINAQACTESWMKLNGAYIPYPATWLRGERWDDELTVVLPNVVNQKPWDQTWEGIVAKGKEMGIVEKDFSHPQFFKHAVIEAAKRAA